MVQELARKTAKKMENQGVIASKTIPIYAYGLELLYSSLAGVVALIIISAILGKPFLWIPYLAGFVPLRLSGGGYHAKTHFHCIFTFSLLYSLVLVIEIMCTVPMKAWLLPRDGSNTVTGSCVCQQLLQLSVQHGRYMRKVYNPQNIRHFRNEASSALLL